MYTTRRTHFVSHDTSAETKRYSSCPHFTLSLSRYCLSAARSVWLVRKMQAEIPFIFILGNYTCGVGNNNEMTGLCDILIARKREGILSWMSHNRLLPFFFCRSQRRDERHFRKKKTPFSFPSLFHLWVFPCPVIVNCNWTNEFLREFLVGNHCWLRCSSINAPVLQTVSSSSSCSRCTAKPFGSSTASH